MMISKVGFWIKHKEMDRTFICREMDVSQNTLSSWCTGKSFPPLPKAFKLAKLLGVTVIDLWEYIEDNEKNPLR